MKLQLEFVFNNVLFFDQFVVFFNHNRILFQKFSHGFYLQKSTTPNTNIIWPFSMMKMNLSRHWIPSLNRFKLVMTHATLKFFFISIYESAIPKTQRARKETWGNYIARFLTKLKGFQYLLVSLTIVDNFAINSSRWTWLHHHLI
jgi:hypothetical protein